MVQLHVSVICSIIIKYEITHMYTAGHAVIIELDINVQPNTWWSNSFYLSWLYTVQITFIFIDFRVCDFAFAFKTQNVPCVSRFKRVLFSDRFQFAF